MGWVGPAFTYRLRTGRQGQHLFWWRILLCKIRNSEAKKDLEEKITAFRRKSNNRFELAIAFLKDANQAEKYAQQENPERIRDFLKKIGSNFRLAEQTLNFDFKNAFKIAEKYHAEALCAEATSFNFAECKTWRRGRDSNSRSLAGHTLSKRVPYHSEHPSLDIHSPQSSHSFLNRRMSHE